MRCREWMELKRNKFGMEENQKRSELGRRMNDREGGRI
jgi:hypothetical protein